MRDHLFIFALSELLAGVFGADDVVRLSVMEGDSVTLHINPDEINNASVLLWVFSDEETFLAKIDRETHQTSIPGNNDERFRNRLQVDQTGSLTITDVRTTDSGLYKLQISSSEISHKRLNVTVTGVFGADGVVRLSAKEGESVTLHINPDEIQNSSDLLWMFNDEETFLAKIDRETNQTSIPGNNDERFRNRLQMDDQTGSLTITDVRTTDSGLYKLQISSSSGISYKRFYVTVTEPSQTSHWMITGPVLSITMVLTLMVSLIKHKRCRNNKDGDNKDVTPDFQH
ncbi:uncharacterized protein LOC130430426 [Triplophysa dalaica]|uniref:uncharacterized protein LOC130430426 n=1 Tax=Triplophysa dalaica TaxID=1582913 RepID=UPI0024DF33B2|nr:uncharacterized protein LOC130430426 [Triplophysa dalaica]